MRHVKRVAVKDEFGAIAQPLFSELAAQCLLFMPGHDDPHGSTRGIRIDRRLIIFPARVHSL